MQIRPTTFAGSWYPSGKEECRRQIEAYFSTTPPAPSSVGEPLGGIVPHAGWMFSGQIAGQVVGLIRKGAAPDTVILLGGHLGPQSEHLIMSEGAWDTPFGPLEVDGEMADRLVSAVSMRIEPPERSQPDNTRELQLPLIAQAFPGARILPVAVAPREDGIHIGAECSRAAQQLGRTVRVLGSTDLTHYGTGYGFAPKGRGPSAERWVREIQDPAVIEKMEQMKPEEVIEVALAHRNACCPGAAAAAVACMKALGARIPQLVRYATSRDIHPGDDFVGYVGMVFWS